MTARGGEGGGQMGKVVTRPEKQRNPKRRWRRRVWKTGRLGTCTGCEHARATGSGRRTRGDAETEGRRGWESGEGREDGGARARARTHARRGETRESTNTHAGAGHRDAWERTHPQGRGPQRNPRQHATRRDAGRANAHECTRPHVRARTWAAQTPMKARARTYTQAQGRWPGREAL